MASARDTSPLTLGVSYLDSGNANSAAGVATSNTLTPDKAAMAIIKGLNLEGGLAGRQVNAIYATSNNTAADYGSEAQAACQKLTRDNKVPLVVDINVGSEALNGCLQNAGVATVGNGGFTGPRLDRLRLTVSTGLPTPERRVAALLTRGRASGYLTPQSKLGILVEGCPDYTSAYTDTVAPLISRLGLPPALKSEITCTTGYSALGGISADLQSAVLRFNQAGVDRVLMLSKVESTYVILFSQSAESQQYRPGYVLSSGGQAGATRPNVPAGQQPQLRGWGNLPGLDIDDPRTPPTGVSARCEALLEKGGQRAVNWQDGLVRDIACGPLLLTEAALLRNGGKADPASILAGVASLGDGFSSPGQVSPRSSYSSTRRDGVQDVAPFAFDPACTCERYTGPPVPIDG